MVGDLFLQITTYFGFLCLLLGTTRCKGINKDTICFEHFGSTGTKCICNWDSNSLKSTKYVFFFIIILTKQNASASSVPINDCGQSLLTHPPLLKQDSICCVKIKTQTPSRPVSLISAGGLFISSCIPISLYPPLTVTPFIKAARPPGRLWFPVHILRN